MVDPICDMQVEPATAAGKYEFNGESYFFCSVHCQKLFQTDPAKYLAAAEARRRRHRPLILNTTTQLQ